MGKVKYISASAAFEKVIEDLEGADDVVSEVKVSMPHCGEVTIKQIDNGTYVIEDPDEILAEQELVEEPEEEEDEENG